MRIELSRNGGAAWETIAASVQNTTATAGTFSWPVSNPITANALVRVTWINGPASGVSAVPFSIVSPVVTVTAPNTAVTWQSGTKHNITFSHNLGTLQPMNIDLSRDGGVTWSPITMLVTTSATSGTYSWLVSSPPTTQARIRVTWAGGSGVSSTSAVNFTISARVALTAPSTAVTWGAGSTRTITWTHNLGTSQTVDLALSPDNGITWLPIAFGVPNATATTGSYTGPMPSVTTTQGLIRVSWSSDPWESDVSDVPITLATPAITVTAPNTNVSWVVGTTNNINWSHNLGTAESVELDLSADGGTTWTPIAASAPDTANTSGTFKWLVTLPLTSKARVRATWLRNTAVSGASAVNFSIVSPVTVTAPNTAVTWGAGSIRTITWNHVLGSAQTFDIATSADNGATWVPLASGVPAATATTGTFTGPMPATVTTQALVRVSPAGNPALTSRRPMCAWTSPFERRVRV